MTDDAALREVLARRLWNIANASGWIGGTNGGDRRMADFVLAYARTVQAATIEFAASEFDRRAASITDRLDAALVDVKLDAPAIEAFVKVAQMWKESAARVRALTPELPLPPAPEEPS